MSDSILWPQWPASATYTLEEFMSLEYRFFEQFKVHWRKTRGEPQARLTEDEWLDHYFDFLAAVDGGQIQLKDSPVLVINVVVYDGTPATLPDEGRWVMVMQEGSLVPCPAVLDLDGADGKAPYWMRSDENNWLASPGDHWAYLPTLAKHNEQPG